MAAKRKPSYRMGTLDIAEGSVRRFWLVTMTIGVFLFGYYFFAEVWPALLRAGSG